MITLALLRSMCEQCSCSSQLFSALLALFLACTPQVLMSQAASHARTHARTHACTHTCMTRLRQLLEQYTFEDVEGLVEDATHPLPSSLRPVPLLLLAPLAHERKQGERSRGGGCQQGWRLKDYVGAHYSIGAHYSACSHTVADQWLVLQEAASRTQAASILSKLLAHPDPRCSSAAHARRVRAAALLPARRLALACCSVVSSACAA